MGKTDPETILDQIDLVIDVNFYMSKPQAFHNQELQYWELSR